MRAITIIEPGPLATVQDKGRFGFRHCGVPVCGAMDPQALRLANLLAGNRADAACIEITMGGFSARFQVDAHFALAGARSPARLNGGAVSSWRRCFARKGEMIEIGLPLNGFRTYLAVEGGLDVSPVMGSRSTFLKGGLGGLEGRALRKEDVLFLGPAVSGGAISEIPAELIPACSDKTVLRALAGPQIDRLSPCGMQTFWGSEYVVLSRSDRMGSLLCGPAVELECGADIISDGAFPGAVQIPGNGQPVVLGCDCQTTGGYVKAASVIAVDLPGLGQLGPGATVRFARVGLDEARLAYLKNEYLLGRLFEKSHEAGGGR